MIRDNTNFYLVKGKIKDFDPPLYLDSFPIEKVESILAKEKKIKSGKKSKDVWFVELENVTWLETGELKNWEKTGVTISITPNTPASFIKADKKQKLDDIKALARPDKKREIEDFYYDKDGYRVNEDGSEFVEIVDSDGESE